jgi:hypothetical protein
MATCQGQHPDGSPCRNPAPAGQTRCYIHRRPNPSARLSREDVLAAIEEHGGPEGLDLSFEDLTNIDLKKDAVQELPVLKPQEGGCARSHHTKGLNLGLTKFQGAILMGAKLERADLYMANLQSARLVRAGLQGARLLSADLRGADLFEADLGEADLRWARLEGVDLRLAKDIRGVWWHGAMLDTTHMRRKQLVEAGAREIKAKIRDEEDAKRWEKDCSKGWEAEYCRALNDRDDERKRELCWDHENHSYDRAREAYLALKNNFKELGRYDDASWAYRKERRMERKMSAWCRAAREYREEKERIEEKHRWLGRPWFYIRHGAKWLADTAVQGVTDYGESPRLVLGWAALILLVVYSLIYWAAAGRPTPSGNFLTFALDYLLLSLGSFSTLGLRELGSLNIATRLWADSEAMLGISLLALLMFTLGRRISRS